MVRSDRNTQNTRRGDSKEITMASLIDTSVGMHVKECRLPEIQTSDSEETKTKSGERMSKGGPNRLNCHLHKRHHM